MTSALHPQLTLWEHHAVTEPLQKKKRKENSSQKGSENTKELTFCREKMDGERGHVEVTEPGKCMHASGVNELQTL